MPGTDKPRHVEARANPMEPVLAHSKYTSRLIPTKRPTKEASLAEYRRRRQQDPTRKVQQNNRKSYKGRRPSTAHGVHSKISTYIRETYGQAGQRIQPAGTGVLFRPQDCIPLPSQAGDNKGKTRPATAKNRRICRKNPSDSVSMSNRRPNFHKSVFVGTEGRGTLSLKKFQVPARAGLHLPRMYRLYDLQGRRIDESNRNARNGSESDEDKALEVRGGPKAEDMYPLPDKWPEIGDYVRIAAHFRENNKCPSTGWVRVAPGEIGEVIDTGHVMVTALFPSGLGEPWVGERQDVEVMSHTPDGKVRIMGSTMAARLRGLPEMRDRGRTGIGSFYGPDFFAARRRGGGMVRAKVVVPHEFIGSAGFTIGHNCEKIDAVNYTDEDGCTMWVTLKPGDDKELRKVVARETKGRGRVTTTPKQYSAGWSYYPSPSSTASERSPAFKASRTQTQQVTSDTVKSSSQGSSLESGSKTSGTFRTSCRSNEKLSSRQDLVPPSTIEVDPSRISEAASEAYHHNFTSTKNMPEDERQRLMSRLSKQAQKGSARILRPYLRRAPEIVDWGYARSRNRTLLHYAAAGASLEVIKLLLSVGADPQCEDDDGKRPVDEAEHHLTAYAESLSKDPHTRRRYLKCRAMLMTTTVHTAAKDGDLNRVVYLCVEHDPTLLNSQNRYGMTPLHFAAMQGHFDVCKALSDAGADWHAQNNIRQTPLDLAVGNPDILSLLPERIRNSRLVHQADEYAKIVASARASVSEKCRSRAMQFTRATSAASIIAADPLAALDGPKNYRKKTNGSKTEKILLGGAFTKYARSRKGFRHTPQSRQLITDSASLNVSTWKKGARGDTGRRPNSGLGHSGRPPQSLDVGGSALSALPGVDFGSAVGHSSVLRPPLNESSLGNVTHMKKQNGSTRSKDRQSHSTLISKASTVPEEGSVNFKGKSAWWDRKEPRHSQILYQSQTSSLPPESSLSYQKGNNSSNKGKIKKRNHRNKVFMPSPGSLAFEKDLRTRYGFVD